ncbi:LPS assembly lipoprotein LptE [Rhizobium sp. PAMB 3182]
MSYKSKSSILRRLVVAATLGLALTSAGCQVQPLYSQQGKVPAELASVGISQAGDRVGLEVRNRLIFLMSGGAGEPANPAYELNLKINTKSQGVLIDSSSDTANAGRVVVTGDYTLTRLSDGEVLRAASRKATALVDYSSQQFAKIRAGRDAENRAAKELAEMIRADLLVTLSQQPM